MLSGADAVKIHGEWIPVRAEVAQLQSASSHADREELVGWLKRTAKPPLRVFITHGEPAAADTLRQYIRREIDLDVCVPEHGETFSLDRSAASGSPADS